MATENYTYGRGRVMFSRFLENTQTPGPYRYVGNTTAFNMNNALEELVHYSSDYGFLEQDAKAYTQLTRGGSFTCDDIQGETVAWFYFGSASVLTTVAAADQSENIDDVQLDRLYQIGVTATNPGGIRGIGSVTVGSNPEGTNYVLDTDYRVDENRGMIELLEGGSLTAGSNITVKYSVKATTQELILSGSKPVEGAIKFLEDNPRGLSRDILIPRANIKPNGDLAFKGDTWREIPFTFDVLKPTVGESVYINGQPQTS